MEVDNSWQAVAVGAPSVPHTLEKLGFTREDFLSAVATGSSESATADQMVEVLLADCPPLDKRPIVKSFTAYSLTMDGPGGEIVLHIAPLPPLASDTVRRARMFCSCRGFEFNGSCRHVDWFAVVLGAAGVVESVVDEQTGEISCYRDLRERQTFWWVNPTNSPKER